MAKKLNGIERSIITYQGLYNDGLRSGVVEALRVADEIRQGGPGAWASFRHEPRWGDTPPPSPGFKKLRLYTLRWIFGVTGEAAKNASFYYRAVQVLVDEGVELDDMQEQLKDRTLKDLAKTRASLNRQKRKSSVKGPAHEKSDQKTLALSKNKVTPPKRFDGSIQAEFVGNTQCLLGMETGRDIVLHGRILAVGKSFVVQVRNAAPDSKAAG
ncbi:hypothetical protein NKH64_14095 [Mesorhizobium sp. M0999]|uniref:hypothetical protein n=1 Tax=Mesorhizobium sp. M0999 TaxID=2957045 RepID=UPI00333A31AE